jgi:hypothetical protein
MRIPKLLKDPLAHFLGIGLILFLILSALKPPADENQIIVNRDTLLTFIQYRSRAFESDAAGAMLDQMSETERKQIIKEYIDEEALYRMAKELGLDEDDYVIRRRMVQKVEFMLESALAPVEPETEALQQYYEKHAQEYIVPPGATFTHVFISGQNRTRNEVITKASFLLQQLQTDEATFVDAVKYGDRFLYHTNYVERTYDYIQSHFGPDVTGAIFSSETPLEEWTGPLWSEYGAHIVYITTRTPERTPSLEEVRERVAEDYLMMVQKDQMDSLVADIVEEYSPKIELNTESPSKTAEPTK